MDKDLDPIVSVIMPVYNADRYVADAITSVLNQSFTNFEFLIFDDGSSDNTKKIIESFKDIRIKVFLSNKNQGYIKHLNDGLKEAKGSYIARMDADDICLADRFEKQVAFMNDHPDVGVCGTQISIMDETGQIMHNDYSNPTDDESARIRLLTDSCFAHPSVMIRKSVLEKNSLSYNNHLLPAEDYDLWIQIANHSKLANLPEKLLKYRVHFGQISSQKKLEQEQVAASIRILLIQSFLGYPLDSAKSNLHNSLFTGKYTFSKQYILSSKQWLEYLVRKNITKPRYNTILFEQEMARLWFSLCTHTTGMGIWIVFIYFSSKLDKSGVRLTMLIKFVCKSVMSNLIDLKSFRIKS